MSQLPLERLCQALPAQRCLPRQWLAEKTLPENPEPESLSQKWWTEKIHVKVGDTLPSLLCGQCQDCPSVGAWLRVIPSRETAWSFHRTPSRLC